MPITWWIEKDRRRVRAVVSGAFSTDDILRTISKVVTDPDFERGFDILSDHTRIGRPITTTQIRDMTAHLAGLSVSLADARWAVVTTKPASYGMMRMLAVFAERIPMTVEVFNTLGEAEDWVGRRESHPGQEP